MIAVLLLIREGASDPEASGGEEPEGVSIPSSAAGADGFGASASPKAGLRSESKPRPTHDPEQLEEFVLPAVAIDKLRLSEALEVLNSTYREGCAVSGEVPLELRFETPPTAKETLSARLEAGDLDRLVRRLGALAGYRVVRQGNAFLFSRDELDGQAERRWRVPPDLVSRLRREAGLAEGTGLMDALTAAGWVRDGSTEASLQPASSSLEIRTSDAGDLARLEGMVESLEQAPLQVMVEAKVFQVPAGSEWEEPEEDVTRGEGEQVERELAAMAGVEMMKLPSFTARNGEMAQILVDSDLQPRDGEWSGPGRSLNVTPAAIGFGHALEFSYVEIADLKGRLEERVSIQNSPFVGDGRSVWAGQTHSDGSRTVLMLFPQLIDATGRPVRRAQE